MMVKRYSINIDILNNLFDLPDKNIQTIIDIIHIITSIFNEVYIH